MLALLELLLLDEEKFFDIIGAKFHIFEKNIYPWNCTERRIVFIQ